MGYKKVTVMVTDEDEPGVITLSAQQPQVEQELTAAFNDPEDGITPHRPRVAVEALLVPEWRICDRWRHVE